MPDTAHGQGRCRACSDLQEILAREGQSEGAGPAFHAEDMLDDPELERLHAERLAELRAEAERRAAEPAQPLYGERADAGHLLNGSGVDGLISGSDCVPA